MNSEAKRTSKISSKTKVYWSRIGEYSYIGEDSRIMKANIGKFCSIGSGVELGVPGHSIDKISTSPVFFSGSNIFNENFSDEIAKSYYATVDIGNDVWIGANVMIKPGISVGNGAIVGMGSIVTHNIPAYEIWAGNPAHKIRNRFPYGTISLLSKSNWWDCEFGVIKSSAKVSIDPTTFIKEIENENNSHR